MMVYTYLTPEDLIRINSLIVVKNGETPFVRNPQGLDSLTSLPMQNIFGTEVYPTIDAKIGIVFIKLIKLHCFEDGNKRTAVATLNVLAEANDYKLTFQNQELADFTLRIAKIEDSDLNYEEIYKNIKNQLLK